MLTATPLTITGKSLFSQHYLETRLPAQPEWQVDPRAALNSTLALWQRLRATSPYGSAMT